MLFSFIDHSIKGVLRNAKFDLRLFLKILSGVSIFYLFIALIYLGYDFKTVIKSINSSANPVTLINNNLLHLCTAVFILQVFSIKNPLKALLAYLHLPIKRTKLISAILVVSLFNYLLIGLLLFFIPYSIRTILPNYSIQQFFFYLVGILIIFFSVGYISLLVKNLIGISFVFVIMPVCLFFIFYFLDLFFAVSFTTISIFIFNQLINKNVFFLVLIFVVLTGLILVNFIVIKQGFYNIYQNQKYFISYYSPIESYFHKNNIFIYAELEIKLITRNKRIRGFFFIAAFLLFIFYYLLPRSNEGLYYTFIVYILISGLFGYMFLQYLFSWESSYFDFILSTKFDVLKYLKAKYLIYLILSIIVFIVFLPVIIKSMTEVHMFLSALLYNLSFGYFIFFFLATYNKSKIDLNGNIFFNYQGLNSTQFLGLIVIILFPSLILFLLLFEVNLTQSLFILNFLCLIALINQKWGWQIIYRKLLQRKFINLEGYRE